MVKYVLTGFGVFHDVPVNPSEVIVNKLVSGSLLPEKCTVSSCIVEVSIEGVNLALSNLRKNAFFGLDGAQNVTTPESQTTNERSEDDVIWVHLGVNSQQPGFRLEKTGWNEATFRVPDQRGAQPQKQLISTAPDAPASYCSKLDLENLAKTLSDLGFPTETSTDPGRFLCNYIYYNSLEYTHNNNSNALFVHIPPFSVQPAETQLKFLQTLLELLPKFCPEPKAK